MKKLILLSCLVASNVFAADSFRFTEKLTDKLSVTTVTTTEAVTINVSLEIQGLSTVEFTDTNVFLTLQIGPNFSFVDPIHYAETKSRNSVTFVDRDDEGHLKPG